MQSSSSKLTDTYMHPYYCSQGLNNRWNRWSENQSINRWQSMPINRLISIIDEQSMLRFFVIIDFIDYQFLSIIKANRSVNWHRLSSIGFHFWRVLFSVKISKNTFCLCILMMKTAMKLKFFNNGDWYIVENMGERFYNNINSQFVIKLMNCDETVIKED